MAGATTDNTAPIRWTAFVAMFLLIVTIYGCAIYANLSFLVDRGENYQYFPPFAPHVNHNDNKHLGAEYYEIARALAAGKGFANPFKDDTGPTAWMPPVLPTILAALVWLSGDDRDAIMTIAVFFQVNILLLTGILILAIAMTSTRRTGPLIVVALYLAAVIGDFRMWFQFTHDTSFVLMTLDILVAWVYWGEPMARWHSAFLWGLFGGLCALINPIVALVWGVVSLAIMFRDRAWIRFSTVATIAFLTLAPWIARNYLVFGRLIPVKSNLSYELFQSQTLLPDGLLQPQAFGSHPWSSAGSERQEYKRVGEMAFLDGKRALFWKSVRSDPVDYLERASARLLGATVWYVPFNRTDQTRRPWSVFLSRLTHPLPFLAFVILGISTFFQRLTWPQWLILATYGIYLLPYIGVSYYERYAMPLLAVKVLLVIWAADRLLCLIPWPSGQPEEVETVVEEPEVVEG